MRTLVAAVAVLAALACAESALAKGGATALRVCGPAGCGPTLRGESSFGFFTPGMAPSTVPPAPAPFYRLELQYWGATDVERLYYVPSANAVAMQYASPTLTWLWASPALRRLAERVRPFPEPRVTSVRIGSKVFRDGADSYLRLFEQRAAGELPDRASGWITIDLRSEDRSPWTDGSIEFWFSPRSGLLERGLEIIRLPDALAADVAAGRPIDEGRSGSSDLLIALGLLAGVAAAFGVLLRRKRKGGTSAALSPKDVLGAIRS